MDAKIEQGLCKCGCGQRTSVPKWNDASKGWKKGVPLDYLKGHQLKTKRGETALRWKGGRSANADGYVKVWTPDGRRYEHVLIAEETLGRNLRDGEVVHHINGAKSDNRRENLLICSRPYHMALHARLEKSESWPEFNINPRNKGGRHASSSL